MALFESPGLGGCCPLHFSFSVPIGSASAFYLTTKREEEDCTDMIIPTWLDGLGGPCHSEPTPPQNRELIPLRQALSRVSQSMSLPSASTLHEPYPMARAGQAAK